MITLVQQYFSESAQKYPQKLAISCESQAVTFREADEFSNSFARHLQSLGVTRGSFVPFFMKKSVASGLSILSILKADSAYVPVDVNSPAQRLGSILKSTQAKVIIANNDSEAKLKALIDDTSQVTIVNIDAFSPTDTSPIDYSNLSIDIAYVLFTSGSTGIPKGVMIPHKAIIDYIDWCVETYEITANDVVANHAPLYFDNSTFDLYTAFKSGASLHLVHDELNAVIPRLVSWLKQREISVFFCVPSVLTMLLKSRRLKPDSMQHIKHLICAGEVLPRDILDAWMEMYPHIQFTNMYGPTEITVDCSYHMMKSRPEAECLSIPIGKARKNMELFVRTEEGKLTQAPGVPGELLVRGTSVAYGYLGDTQKTEAAFIQNPNHSLYHDPLYCTGDLVKIDENGDYLFLGRADDQIKFLGYRIELGEIEASLNSVDGVVEGVVVFNDSEDESQREIGALVSADNDMDSQMLTQALQEKLPSYMVPSRIVFSSQEYPRTPNGKYNRKAIKSLVFGNS
ncbi:amino acid adenylation domain-containing protein [Aliikangiella marina]|uniref:Amino acid adenylation domain-containing protein n=1 Tax=Aliikangiella marina TaxID=1712262 RepID=A0A545T7M0_9GAMM|nr:amino acid adenylation domain-containing protein [Aliikangiella marina]TQV73182.1 amino acid adenylation domain-containing protein [Aliikangiella marina]